MTIDVVTAFPRMFQGPFSESILRHARAQQIVQIRIHDLRAYTRDRHRTVDDYDYGGGTGMVLKPEPFFLAVQGIQSTLYSRGEKPRVLLLSPQGEPFQQDLAKQLAQVPGLILLCGHYKGVDERVRPLLNTTEVSVGDYVLTGGEMAAMTIIDAVVRLLPGVLGNVQSAQTDSFFASLLDYPHYTRPEVYQGHSVPPVLLSGNHQEIRNWRRREALRITLQKRPDLLKKAVLSEEERILVDTLYQELTNRA